MAHLYPTRQFAFLKNKAEQENNIWTFITPRYVSYRTISEKGKCSKQEMLIYFRVFLTRKIHFCLFLPIFASFDLFRKNVAQSAQLHPNGQFALVKNKSGQ